MVSRDKPRILLVEDEASIREGVCDVLAYHGYAPDAAASGELGLSQALAVDYALLILDVMLPGMSGFEVCQRVREQRAELPIMMLTAKGAEDDVVEGFRLGADDYVTKPFSVRELAARVRALLKRSGRIDEPALVNVGDWVVDAARGLGRRGDEEIELTPREIAILSLLCQERGRIVGRRRLLQQVWKLNNPDQIETRTVDVHMAKLRKKLDRNGRSWIETVRGQGYRLVSAP
ncbi:MAG TPA: response regulator transcription factor [Polyangiales bacterium]|nr:response regulator transcription factor [Polyangiales bacterium]